MIPKHFLIQGSIKTIRYRWAAHQRFHQKWNWKQTPVFKTTDNLKKGKPGKTVVSVARKESLRLGAENYPVPVFNDTLFTVYTKLGSFSTRTELMLSVSNKILRIN
jgi:hypothetical protein